MVKRERQRRGEERRGGDRRGEKSREDKRVMVKRERAREGVLEVISAPFMVHHFLD
jgi:hypothetical protein